MGLLQPHGRHGGGDGPADLTGFPARIARTARWAGVGEPSLEHCRIEATASGVAVRSVVIGARGGRPYGLRYAIDCDEAWRVDRLEVSDVEGPRLAMAHRDGRWFGADGTHDGRFDGTRLVDLAGTPLTNTLALRAMPGHRPGDTAEFAVLYVPFDTLQPLPDAQRYTCREPFRLYHFEAVDGTSEALLPIDAEGLVSDYPGLFRRCDPGDPESV